MVLLLSGFAIVVQAGNTDINQSNLCQRWTASGTNRSGTCNNLQQGGGSNPRRGNASWSHQQFNLSTSANWVSRGSFNTAHMTIAVCNGLTSTNSTAIRHGHTGSVSRGRVAFFRPYSGAGIGQ